MSGGSSGGTASAARRRAARRTALRLLGRTWTSAWISAAKRGRAARVRLLVADPHLERAVERVRSDVPVQPAVVDAGRLRLPVGPDTEDGRRAAVGELREPLGPRRAEAGVMPSANGELADSDEQRPAETRQHALERAQAHVLVRRRRRGRAGRRRAAGDDRRPELRRDRPVERVSARSAGRRRARSGACPRRGSWRRDGRRARPTSGREAAELVEHVLRAGADRRRDLDDALEELRLDARPGLGARPPRPAAPSQASARRRGRAPPPRRANPAWTCRSSLAADAVYGPAGGFPGVVRGARPETGLVLDDARVPADLLRALGVAQQVRVVALLPDEDQMRRGHELGDEVAPVRRARERIGRDAVPARMVRPSSPVQSSSSARSSGVSKTTRPVSGSSTLPG